MVRCVCLRQSVIATSRLAPKNLQLLSRNAQPLNCFVKIVHFSCWQKRILEYTKYDLLNKALQAFEDLRDDEELGPADWPTVENYILSLKDSEGEQVHPHSDSKTGNLDHTSLKDIRIRFLNGNYYHVSLTLSTYYTISLGRLLNL